MATAKKLPSGSWRCQVFDHKDVDGKKHYKSFTATTKREAQFLAAQWAADKKIPIEEKLTVYEAITRYVDSKRDILSPSTIRAYDSVRSTYFNDIGMITLKDISNTAIQVWINDLSREKKVSPKTIRNAYGILVPALEMFAPDFRIKATLPAKVKPELYVPSDDDVAKLLKHAKSEELEIAILLAAFGPLRRGEICALESSDIHGNTISINKSMVMDSDKIWHIKQPKTYGSYRDLEFPDFVIDKIAKIDGRIVPLTPDQLTSRFSRCIKSSGLTRFRFHDLRHYSASIMHAIGIPDQYILQRGGWSSDNVMKTVYRNVIDIEKTKQTRKMNKHFEKVIE